ncbi:hypothetical protein EGC78_04635 [Shewanella frigidimarina]|nr:hypothetical protein EGC78_04635 [Shewanella frigidimarina]
MIKNYDLRLFIYKKLSPTSYQLLYPASDKTLSIVFILLTKEMVAGVGLDKNYDLRFFIYKKLSPTSYQLLYPASENTINYFYSID